MSGATMAVDPVCGKPVNPHNAYWMIWHKGTPYYFCGEDCQLKFDHKPEHYRFRALDRREKESIYWFGLRGDSLEASQRLGRREARGADGGAAGREDRPDARDAAQQQQPVPRGHERGLG